jgi:hypothetical protein
MTKWTLIRVKTTTAKKLKKIRLVEKESYDSIINRLLKEVEKSAEA